MKKNKCIFILLLLINCNLSKAIEPQELFKQSVMNNSTDGINKAIQVGANIDQQINGRSPLFWAITLKLPNAVTTLLEAGAKLDSTLVEAAIRANDIKTAARIAIKGNMDLNKVYVNNSLLRYAIMFEDYETATLLIKNKAVFEGRELIDKSLESLRINKTNISIVLNLIRELLNQGYKVNDIWSSPNIFYSENTLDILKLIIANNGNVNQIIPFTGSKAFLTPLTFVVGNNPAMKLLVDAGADINLKVDPGFGDPKLKGLHTPLSYAVNTNRSESAKYLMELGAKME